MTTAYAAVDQDTAAAAWYAALNPLARTLVDDCVRDLVRHPRMQGRKFGELSARQLLYCLFVYVETTPGVKWPGGKAER